MCRNMKHKTSKCAFKGRYRHTALALLFFLAALLPARAEYFIIRDYGVLVNIDTSGTLYFTETIEVEFTEQRHGIFRAIPLVNRIEGKRKELIIRDVSVIDWPFEKNREDDNLILKIGHPDRYVNGRQVYMIRYAVHNGLNFFKTHAEFYWDLLGISWEVPVEAFHFEILLPDGVPLTEDDIRLYTGLSGSTEREADFRILQTDGGVRVGGQTLRAFAPHEAVTIALRLPKGAFPEPDPWDTWFTLHGILLLPAGLLGSILLLLFYSRNRRQTIMVEYQPPLDISPAVAGGFIDHHVENHDVISLIPLLAEKGFLRLEVEETEQFWIFKKRDVRFIKLKEADGSLQTFERSFFDALFAGSDTVELDSLKNTFYKQMARIRSEVKAWIDAQQWYEPDQRTNRMIAIGAAVICGVTGFFTVARSNFDGFFLLAAAAVIFVLAQFFRRRNMAGNQIYKRLEGFRLFMVKAERPVLEKLLKEDPHYFDKTLPYAVAFGEVKRWTGLFQDLLSEPPTWYYTRGQVYGSHASWGAFSTNFSSEINDINSVFGSSPSSSSSGGGSSGGGGGGGGGGSW